MHLQHLIYFQNKQLFILLHRLERSMIWSDWAEPLLQQIADPNYEKQKLMGGRGGKIDLKIKKNFILNLGLVFHLIVCQVTYRLISTITFKLLRDLFIISKAGCIWKTGICDLFLAAASIQLSCKACHCLPPASLWCRSDVAFTNTCAMVLSF